VETQITASSDDRSQVSLLRPAASALAGVLVVACLARFGLTVDALIAAFLAVVLVVLSVVDIERRILPDRIVLPSALVVLVAQIAVDSGRAVECVLAALGLAAFLLVAGLISRGGIGMGDVKLGLLLGAGLGKHAITALLLGSLAGGLASAIILARGGAEARKKAIPYGPFLALGGIIALLAGAGFSATPF
jgi:leader peptidase (prepilin peptidase) / N-methyltransferase